MNNLQADFSVRLSGASATLFSLFPSEKFATFPLISRSIVDLHFSALICIDPPQLLAPLLAPHGTDLTAVLSSAHP
jgi:hypothetical protein